MKKGLLFNKVSYIVAIVSEFAKQYGLTDIEAFRYLYSFNVIDFVDEEYDIAHTLNFDEIVDNLTIYCQRFGGALR